MTKEIPKGFHRLGWSVIGTIANKRHDLQSCHPEYFGVIEMLSI